MCEWEDDGFAITTGSQAMRRVLVVAGCFAVMLDGIVGPARAQTPQAPPHAQVSANVAAADAKAVRAVIEAQLKAFASDDAQRAFSYAAPGIRAQFASAEHFVAMVRGAYPMVYRHSGVAFLKPVLVDGDLVQAVQLDDTAGGQWVATYVLLRQPDKSWRIGGCRVEQRTGLST